MAIIKWRPFHDIERFFDDSHFLHHPNGWDLAVDVSEDDNNVVVEMHVPDVDPDKVEIEVDNHHLHVSGSREEKKESSDRHYHRREIKRGSFDRVIPLPSTVDTTGARAEFKDGVLRVSLPKNKARQTNKIKVERS